MASTKTRIALLVIVALCAYLTSKTDAHLKIGRKEFTPVRQELRESPQDQMNPVFGENKNRMKPGQKWEPTIEEIQELYKQGIQED